MDVKEYIKNHVLLFDGAMGTYYATQYPEDTAKCEWANLRHPERIEAIHRAYIEAGAKAIKTNTFGANTQVCECTWDEVSQVITAGWEIAKRTAGNAEVFADIGPLPESTAEYQDIVKQFLTIWQLISKSRIRTRMSWFRSQQHRMDLPGRDCRCARFYHGSGLIRISMQRV